MIHSPKQTNQIYIYIYEKLSSSANIPFSFACYEGKLSLKGTCKPKIRVTERRSFDISTACYLRLSPKLVFSGPLLSQRIDSRNS